MKTILITLLALILHLTLGWQWSIVAAAVGGYWQGQGGWRVGLIALTVSWLLLLVWNYLVAPNATSKVFGVMSGIFGGLPSFAFPLFVLLWAALIGAIGGAIGTYLKHAIKPPSRYVSRYR